MLHVKPTCWSSEFFEAWPPDLNAFDVTAECAQTEPDRIDACTSERYWFAYQRLLAWTSRWFDDCDPKR